MDARSCLAMLKKVGVERKQLISVEDDMKRKRGVPECPSLSSLVCFAQIAPAVQTIHEESIFNVVLRRDRPDELFEHEEMQRVR